MTSQPPQFPAFFGPERPPHYPSNGILSQHQSSNFEPESTSDNLILARLHQLDRLDMAAGCIHTSREATLFQYVASSHALHTDVLVTLIPWDNSPRTSFNPSDTTFPPSGILEQARRSIRLLWSALSLHSRQLVEYEKRYMPPVPCGLTASQLLNSYYTSYRYTASSLRTLYDGPRPPSANVHDVEWDLKHDELRQERDLNEARINDFMRSIRGYLAISASPQGYREVWHRLERIMRFVPPAVRVYAMIMEMDVWRGVRTERRKGYQWWDGFWEAAEEEVGPGLLTGLIGGCVGRWAASDDGEGHAGLGLDGEEIEEEGGWWDPVEEVMIYHRDPPENTVEIDVSDMELWSDSE